MIVIMAEGGVEGGHDVADAPTSLPPGVSGSATLADGGIVNLQLMKSTVNIVAGDRNYVTNNMMNAEREASTVDQNSCLGLIQTINENSSRTTADKILEDFADEDLGKPDFQVHPQMRRVTRSEYFKGNYEEVHDMEVTTKRKFLFWKTKEVTKNQFRKEYGFLRRQIDDNRFIALDDVLQQVINEESSITAIVASAGSGKTTLMRRIARRTLGHSLTNTEAIASSSELKYKLIRYIEMKGMRHKEFIKPSKFLFGGLFQNEIDEDHAYQWLLENQSEAVFFFDGLDQATWGINRDGNEKINPYTPTDAATIMYNILSRNLLADTKIVISSREFQVSDLPVEARPDEIITLSGLTLDDANKLFVFLIGQNGDEAWEKIETMSPRLINLVSIPVFLVLTAVIMAKDPTEAPPKTVTGLYKKIVSTLSSVKNIQQADAIAEVIKKLKAMAYRGMKEGRVSFLEHDLNMFGISKEEVKDLMMKVPGNNLLSCNLLDGSFIFYFCHQSMQEFLAAGFVAEMSLLEFVVFNYEDLHKERWSVVRRFVYGIIYDQSSDHLHEVSNRSLKQPLLTASIRLQLTRNEDNHFRMELYTAIYESGDNDLMRQISDINASEISLSRDKAHICGSLAARSDSLKCLNLSYCNINDELLAIIAVCLKKRTQVKKVDLRANNFLVTALRSLLGHRRIESLSGNLDWQVKKVDLRANNFSATALRSLLGHRRIESLSGNLDWQVIELTVGGWYVELKNEEEVIKISGRVVDGHFNIKDSNLYFYRIHTVAVVAFLGRLFDAKFIKLKEQKQLLAKQDDLRNISECRLEKMSKILLDCTQEENIDWSLIETNLEKYQVGLLDIAVNGQISTDDYKRILKRGRAISVFGNIRAMFFVQQEGEFEKIEEACQQKKIEYIRCILRGRCRASLVEIASLVKNSNLKKISLIHTSEDDMLNADELQTVQKIANVRDTELEVLKVFRETDAWKILDLDFHYRMRSW